MHAASALSGNSSEPPPVNSFSSIKNSVELRRTAPAAGGKAPFWIAGSDYLYLNI